MKWLIVAGLNMCFVAALFNSCTPEDELITNHSGVTLSFSQDTVLFDTLFTTRQSITRRLKVYNTQANAVETGIRLAGGSSSPYTVLVNGQAGGNFGEVRLRGGDSLLILVEVLIDPQDSNTPFLVRDSLIFLTNGTQQTVQLRSWGQDVYFVKSLVVNRDTTLAFDRPHVIMDSIWVQENASMHLEAGTQLYFERGASIWVDGQLRVQGSQTSPVLFTHTRLDGNFANAPGQWQGVLLSEKSSQNVIDYAIIRNAEVGVFVSQTDTDTLPDLLISNTIIENMSVSGILASNADIEGYNLLISRCVANTVSGFGRGHYCYTHCTFANDVASFAREGPVAYFSDTLSAARIDQPFSLVLQNNIIWGNRADELSLVTELPNSRVIIRNNLIKLEGQSEFVGDSNILNEDPQFTDPVVYVYQLDSTSAAIDQGVVTPVTQDLVGELRDLMPDLGAYEYIKPE